MYIRLSSRPRSSTGSIIAELVWPILFLALSLSFTVGFFVAKTTHVSTNVEPRCLANGAPSFPWNRTINEYWNPSTALFITLGSGKFTFPEAKSIDVFWDLLVGRGGQLITAILAYKVLRKSLLLCMEEKAVPIPLARSIYFHNVGLSMLKPLFGNLALPFRASQHTDKAVPRYRLMSWLYLCLYVSILPTIISAMTGYQTTADIYFHPTGTSSDVLTSGGGMVPNPPLAIRDGSRIGLDDNVAFSIIGAGVHLSDDVPLEFNDTYSTLLGYYYAMQNAFDNTSWVLPIQSAGSAKGYNAPYIIGPRDRNNSSDIPIWSYCTISPTENFCNIAGLEPSTSSQPTQNAPTIPSPKWTWSNITLFNQTHVLQPPPLDIYATGPAESWSAVFSTDTYTGRYFTNKSMASTAVCLPSTAYQWGFSAVLLCLFCCLTIVFAAVLLALEVEVWFYSRAAGMHVDIDPYKDAVHIVSALEEEYGEEVVDGPELLDDKVRSSSGAIAVRTDELPVARAGRGRAVVLGTPQLGWSMDSKAA